jgi:hypothetical protein
LETILVEGAILPLFVPISDTSQSYFASYRIGHNSTGDRRLMRYIMVENYQSADFYLERALDYEQKAERAVDLAARESFLEAAAKWRQSADIYQSIKSLSAAPPTESGDSELPISVNSPTQGASFAQQIFGKLWSNWLGLNRTPG